MSDVQPIGFADVCAKPVFKVYGKLDTVDLPVASDANLFVHQYQIAVFMLIANPSDKPHSVAKENHFAWKWSKPPVSELETFAREFYERCVAQEGNHAATQVAIAAMVQLGRLVGEAAWDIEGVGAYTLYPQVRPSRDVD